MSTVLVCESKRWAPPLYSLNRAILQSISSNSLRSKYAYLELQACITVPVREIGRKKHHCLVFVKIVA
jgi:hypothetical protein